MVGCMLEEVEGLDFHGCIVWAMLTVFSRMEDGMSILGYAYLCFVKLVVVRIYDA